jgi:hypothetical protein
VNFPAIKPNKLLSPDIQAIIPAPQANEDLDIAARRYQIGWVMVEMPNTSYEVGDEPASFSRRFFFSRSEVLCHRARLLHHHHLTPAEVSHLESGCLALHLDCRLSWG